MPLTQLSNIANGNNFVNKSARFGLQDANFPMLLELMGVKQFQRNMFRIISLYVSCLQLSNTSSIIVIDNGR
jgi:hypothetical protein